MEDEDDYYDFLAEKIHKETIAELKYTLLKEKIKRYIKVKNRWHSIVSSYNWDENKEYQGLLTFIKGILEDERR